MNPILTTQNLTVSFNDKKIIDDINICVCERELCGILGLNGSGKTTLLNSIDGLIKYSGKVFCYDSDVSRLHEEERAKIISYIPQRTMLKDGISSLEFVLYALNPVLRFYQFPSEEQREMAKNILVEFGLVDKIYCDFGKLSEGQKQLVVLARSVLQNAPLMLMDEPDSSLDYNNKHLLYSVVKKIITKYNFGGLISIHDPTFALKYCDKIYILSNGKIVGDFYVKESNVSDMENALKTIYKNLEIIEHNGKYIVGFNNED